MDQIDSLAIEDDLTGSFVHKHAAQLFSFIGDSDQYTAKVCYWLASNLDSDYEGECAYDLMPHWNRDLSLSENKRLYTEATEKAMKHSLDIVLKCSGNLLNPQSELGVLEEKDLVFDKQPVIGQGTYGQVYLINGYAVKTTAYDELSLSVICLLRETTALAILGRLRFVGLNNGQYYIGMDYFPEELNYEQPHKAIRELSKELMTFHSLGIIHCDIKLGNVRIDSEGHYRLIDFGSCRFTPSVNATGPIGTHAYCDYRLLSGKGTGYGFEVDIWSLGIVFYMLETSYSPWGLPNDVKGYSKAIEDQWESVMKGSSPLVRGMLSLSRELRWTIEEVVNACLQ
jgi:serine/threonine protein kinase